MVSEVDDVVKGDGDGIVVYGGFIWSEGKSIVCVGFGIGKINVVCLLFVFGDLVLDIVLVGLFNVLILGVGFGSWGDRSVECDWRECDESIGSKSV